MRALRPLLLALALLAPLAAPAVQPDEVLDDPALEARARALSAEIRCLVCRSESIDESNADLARDLRVLVRERLVAGDSDAEVKTFLVDRYGEYVLLKPTFTAANAILWFGGPALLIGGGVLAFFWIRRARPEAAAAASPLSAEEKARLDALMKEDGAA
ncbi:cytochrome c-type biogenesis protein CcmH [Albimonas sp. CAU 1670]|uniref:cytochrome c-type biogenesis protein n=1 Tax=Albimonas sp. CAU 1670 TaxID=3032599 RepID=UPI0023DBD27B|nr:cytochrome c-type biogenesis protein [Albimonas sp. CAU 1670]MDF2232128.1 cytochrome c-type biogenesis protein CcmH [Albimonas sp. CAU 1670]